MSSPVPSPVPAGTERALLTALADVGRAIEAMPPGRAIEAIDAAFDRLGLSDPATARTFLIGVAVAEHAQRAAAVVSPSPASPAETREGREAGLECLTCGAPKGVACDDAPEQQHELKALARGFGVMGA